MARKHGTGSISYDEKTKTYRGFIRTNMLTKNGNCKKISFSSKLKRDVVEWLEENIPIYEKKKTLTKTTATPISLANELVDGLKNNNKIKEVSYLRHQGTIKLMEKLKIANTNISNISIQDINEELSKIKDYSQSTIRKIIGMFNRAFNYALILKFIDMNPFSIAGAIMKPKSEKETKKVRALTIEEQQRFLDNLEDEKYKDVFLIALYTGMRIGEILALKSSDIDIEKRVIKVQRTLTKDSTDSPILGKDTKTKAGTREIPIMSMTYDIFEKLTHIEGLLFTEKNKLIRPSTINTHFKRICKNAQILENTRLIIRGSRKINHRTSTANTHMLRHTFATRSIEAGINAVTLSRILGHTDISITLNTYTDVFNKFKEEEIQKVEKYFNDLKCRKCDD